MKIDSNMNWMQILSKNPLMMIRLKQFLFSNRHIFGYKNKNIDAQMMIIFGFDDFWSTFFFFIRSSLTSSSFFVCPFSLSARVCLVGWLVGRLAGIHRSYFDLVIIKIYPVSIEKTCQLNWERLFALKIFSRKKNIQ